MNNISCFKIRKSILRGMKKSNNGNFQLSMWRRRWLIVLILNSI